MFAYLEACRAPEDASEPALRPSTVSSEITQSSSMSFTKMPLNSQHRATDGESTDFNSFGSLDMKYFKGNPQRECVPSPEVHEADFMVGPKDNDLDSVKVPRYIRQAVHVRKYKTCLCTNWMQTGECGFAEKCVFAHGEAELSGDNENLAMALALAERVHSRRRRRGKANNKAAVSPPTTKTRRVEDQPNMPSPWMLQWPLSKKEETPSFFLDDVMACLIRTDADITHSDKSEIDPVSLFEQVFPAFGDKVLC